MRKLRPLQPTLISERLKFDSSVIVLGVEAMAKEKAVEKIEIDISEHVLVPKHEVLPSDEAEELLRRLGVSRDRLPYILPSDPMVKRLKAKVGDIIKITRKSPTAGETVYYRVVWGES